MRVARGVWDFVVGDDWRTAIGAALALGLTALVSSAGVSAWWVTPLAVCGLLAASLARATRPAEQRRRPARVPSRRRRGRRDGRRARRIEGDDGPSR